MEENLNQNNRPDPNPEPVSELIETQIERKEPERNQRHSSSRHIRQSIDNSGHILEVLRAAMPYIDSRRQNTMEALMKATDLIHTTRNPRPAGELSAASLSATPANLEGMLCSVREIGSLGERDIIDKMLNFFKAKKLYQTYKIFNQNKDLLKAASLGDGSYQNNANFMEALKGILPADQASNLENVQTILNAMNAMSAMGMNNSWNNNSRNNANTSGSTYTPYSNYGNSGNSNYSTRPDSYQQFPKQPVKAKVAPSPASTDRYPNQMQSQVPNYTYQMNNTPSYNASPTIDSNYMNQFAPSVPEPEAAQAASMPAQLNPPAPSTGQQPMDPAAMNNLYQNITNLYHALSASGLANGTQQNNNSMPLNTNSGSQNNMLNVISALANSGLLNNQNSVQAASMNRGSTGNPASVQPAPAPVSMRQPSMKSMPIPNASSFNSEEPASRTRTTKEFNPNQLYEGLSNYRNQNDLSRSSRNSSDVLEAASLEP